MEPFFISKIQTASERKSKFAKHNFKNNLLKLLFFLSNFKFITLKKTQKYLKLLVSLDLSLVKKLSLVSKIQKNTRKISKNLKKLPEAKSFL